jgi:hypothetical protein
LCWRASLSGAKRKADESFTEGGSSDVVMLTSPRASPAKNRTCRVEEKKMEEDEASNRVSPPLQDVEMQDPSRDEGATHIKVEAREVPAIEVVRTAEVPAIEVERTQAEPSEGAKTPPVKEEAEEDKDEERDSTVFSKLVTSAKLAQGLVEVSFLPLSICEADLFCRCSVVTPSCSLGSSRVVRAGCLGAGRGEHRHQSGGGARGQGG